MIKGLFNKIQIKEFLYPLQVISNILDPKDDGGIILNINKETKEINIFTKKMSIGTILFVKFKDLLNTFEITDESIGIINISEFTKYFSVIDDDNTEIEYTDSKFTIKGVDTEICFNTSDISLITESKKEFKFSDWLCEFVYDEKFSKLEKAIKSFINEDFVYIKGDSINNKLSFTVRKSDLDMNKFKFSIDCPIKKDFQIIAKKDIFNVLTSVNCNNMTIKIAERLFSLECERENSVMTFFVANYNIA